MGILTAQITITEVFDGIDGESPWLVTISPNELSVLTDIYGDDPVFDLYEMLVQVAGPEERIPYIKPSQLIPQNVTVGGVTTSDGITFAYTPSPGILKISSMVDYQPITNRVFEVYGDDKFTEYLGKTSLIIRLDRIAVGGLSCTLSNQYQEILCDSDGAVIGELDAKTLVQVKYGNEALTHVPEDQSGRDPGKREFKIIKMVTKGCTVSNTEGLVSLTSLTEEQASVDITISTYFGDTATVTFNVVKKLKPEGAFSIILEQSTTEVVVDTAGKVTSDELIFNTISCSLGGVFLEPFLGDDGDPVPDNLWYINDAYSDELDVYWGANQVDVNVKNLAFDSASVWIEIILRGQSYSTTWRIIKKYPGDVGKTGPSLIYYGEYDKTVKLPYTVQEGTRIIVKYKPEGGSASYRITPVDWTGTIPEGTLITNTTYWTFFGNNFTSVATEILFAENAYIDVLESNNIFVGGLDTGGWVITGENGGEIYHTKTGLRLNADGRLVSPPGGIIFSSTTDPSLPQYDLNLVRYTSCQPPTKYWITGGTLAKSYVGYSTNNKALRFLASGGRLAYVCVVDLPNPPDTTNTTNCQFQYRIVGDLTSLTCYLTNTTGEQKTKKSFVATSTWQSFSGDLVADNNRFGFELSLPTGGPEVYLEIKDLSVVETRTSNEYHPSPLDLVYNDGVNYALDTDGLCYSKLDIDKNDDDWYFKTRDSFLQKVIDLRKFIISADVDLTFDPSYTNPSVSTPGTAYVLIAFNVILANGNSSEYGCQLEFNQMTINGRYYQTFEIPSDIEILSYKYRLVDIRQGIYGTVSNIRVELGENISYNNVKNTPLEDALKGSTTIDGGLILSNIIQLFPAGADTHDISKVSAGISGGSSSSSPAIWAGGTFEEAIARQSKFGVDHRGNAWFQGNIKSTSGLFGCFSAAEEDVYVRDSNGDDVIVISSLPLLDIIPTNQTVSPSITGNGIDATYSRTTLGVTEEGLEDYSIFRISGSYIGNYRFEAKVTLNMSLSIGVSGVNPPGALAKGGAEVYYKIFKTGSNLLQYDSRSEGRMYIERTEILFNNFTWSDSLTFNINKSFFFGDSYIIFYGTYGALLTCYGASNATVNLSASLSEVRLVSTSKKCLHSPDGFHYQFDGSKYFQVNVTNSSSYLSMLAAGLPTSSSGLERNQLYRNGNYIMVNNPTTLEESRGFDTANDDPAALRDLVDLLALLVKSLTELVNSQQEAIQLLTEKVYLLSGDS